ncbi:hypothetical protein HMH01_11265 [Halovulum dunhuangense]|uniref:Protease inhibitor Inh n=1 Tax=Halovulum dunhuangense TaxID=1505036 RepID=A0A849L3T4_9RHOB|nr:hypothetical protein [Halovulum dunhuangense]NNU81016.1 hypothetical protein [Halovulum dunhuangense]
MRAAFLGLCLAVNPALAQVVDPGAFERLSTGRTLSFEQQGLPFGAEQYLPGRRVIWQFADGSCANGIWFPDGPHICFLYDTGGPAQCWLFERRAGNYFARSAGLPPGDPSELRLSGETDGPLACAAPGLGV